MSTSGNTNVTCQMGCWGIAALGAIFAACALWLIGGWSFMQGAFVALLVFLILGVVLSIILCRPLPGPVDISAKSPPISTGGSSGPATAPSSPPSDAAPEAAPAPAQAEPAAPAEPATRASAPTAAAAAPAGDLIKPSAALPGQAELAERKGEWRYDGDTQPAANASAAVDYDGDGVLEGENEGTRPASLDGPREGTADDLKRIKGIGPKLEKLCNSLGFFHFDQIAGWNAQEVAWVDANLEGFKGRVSRDEWVKQASLLATGAETEFSKRVDEGDVY